MGIGKNSHIKNAIVDKNARIGNNVKIINKKGLKEYEDKNIIIRDGVIVVGKNALIADGTVI